MVRRHGERHAPHGCYQPDSCARPPNGSRRRVGWIASVICLVTHICLSVAGIYETAQGETFSWIYDNVLQAHQSDYRFVAGFLYLSFGSTSFFPVRSREAALLLVAGVIVMLTTAPVGKP